MAGLATRLYRGEAGFDIVGKRRLWYGVTLLILLVAIGSFYFRGFQLGIEFEGGNSFQVPRATATLDEARKVVSDAGAEVVSAQEVGGPDGTYLIRTVPLTADKSDEVKLRIADALDVDPSAISDNRVSAAWGSQITSRALIALAVFLALVIIYLVIRFEWRMAIGAIAALAQDLLLTAGIYSLVGFDVTPSTIIGLLTILGFALYDVVVVFDKVQENTRGILGGSRTTYAEAANLAVNQTLMRSINTSVIALLPVGGLLFIGAGLLGAGTLKDLGLVLFVGMGASFFGSIFLATPIVVDLKEREPKYAALRQRVLARRAGTAKSAAKTKSAPVAADGDFDAPDAEDKAMA
ncbi:MAG TPA: protein translocase subunit SecF, partial [Cryptosporangiaceae bacterium]|nr:protein translocase subunit SecF [Cryptosporangiaceae bacterium]